MYYRLIEDVVERRLELIGRHGFFQALAHAVLTLFIVGFVAVYLAGITVSFASKLPANWHFRFDIWWRLIAAELIMGLPGLVVGYFVLRAIAAGLDGGWRRLIWDERLAEFSAMKRVGVLRLTSYSKIPFADLEQIVLHASPGGKNLALKLSIGSDNFVNHPLLEAAGTVQYVDRREEAMDLLFRIGRACGLDHYAVEDSDIRNLKLCLRREPQGKTHNGRFQPIPSAASAARYDDNLVPTSIPAPEIKVGPFHPETLANSAGKTRLVEWQPGVRVRFHTPAADWAEYVVHAGVAAIVGGVLAYGLAPLARPWLPGWATMIVAIAVAPLAASGWVFFRFCERETTIDWLSKQVTWRIGSRTRHASFSNIHSLQLRGLKRTINRKKQPSYDEHWGRLEVLLDRGAILVLESDALRRDPDGPPRQLGPLTAALAESLGVPWQWRDYNA